MATYPTASSTNAAVTPAGLPTQMLAIQKPQAAPGFKLIWAAVPQPGPYDVLIEVKLASLCGTDLHITQWDEWSQSRIKPPLIYGHEFCGTVVQVGEHVTHLEPGQFVAAEMHIPCDHCFQCRTGNPHYCEEVKIAGVDTDGCFAQYLKLPVRQVIPLPDSISPGVGACLDSLGNAVHAVTKGEVSGKSVHVVGCGPIGLFSIRLAQVLGASQVFASDVVPYRLELAKQAGADRVIAADQENVTDIIQQGTDGRGCDVVLEMSGSPHAISTAFQAMRIGGRFVMLGIPARPLQLDLAENIIFKASTVVGVNGREMFQTWISMLDLLKTERLNIDFMLTHRYGLHEFDQVIHTVASGQSGKILIDPHAVPPDAQPPKF